MTRYKMKDYGRIRWYILSKMGYKVGKVEFYAQMRVLEVEKIFKVKAISRKYRKILIEHLTARRAYIYI